MSLLSREDFCKGSVTGTVEDCENDISINFEVFIPKKEYSHSDDDFEIYLDGTEDSDYHEEWSDNLEKAIYDSCFLETICDYAFASRTKEIIYTDNSCKIYIESSDLEWDEKASEHDAYLTSIRMLGIDGLPKLQTKEEQLEEIEEIAQEIADLFDDGYENFVSHIIDAVTQKFISDDDLNRFTTDNIIEESAKWFILTTQTDSIELNEFKTDLANHLNIELFDKNGNNENEQSLEDNILSTLYRMYNIECEDSIISEDVNNFKITSEQAVKIAYNVIYSEYLEQSIEEY